MGTLLNKVRIRGYFKRKEGQRLDQALDLTTLPARIPALGEIVDLGLAPEVIRLRRMRMPAWEIAKKLGINTWQVQHFIRTYNKMNPEDRGLLFQRNVFDMAEQLSEKVEDLQEMLAVAQGLEGSTPNPELQLKIHTTGLALMKMIADLAERVEYMRRTEKFQMTVLQILDTYAPGIRAKALKALSDEMDSLGSMGNGPSTKKRL